MCEKFTHYRMARRKESFHSRDPGVDIQCHGTSGRRRSLANKSIVSLRRGLGPYLSPISLPVHNVPESVPGHAQPLQRLGGNLELISELAVINSIL
jgi:hypothetical protein